MARKSWIKPFVKAFIIDEAVNNPKEPRPALYLRLKTSIEEMGEVAPAEETAYKMISDARHTPTKFGEPWTLASLSKKGHDLPPESIPAVVQIFRYASNTGEIFSLGQAEWVSRLYRLFPDYSDNPGLLWYWSNEYSYQERLSILSDEKMDSSLLDRNIIFSQWEKVTLDRTDFWDGFRIRWSRYLYRHTDGNIAHELLHGIKPRNPWGEDEIVDERDHELTWKVIKELSSLDSLDIGIEAKLVYLRWFTHITKGPDWKKLTPKDALNVIISLRELVLAEQKNRSSSNSEQVEEFLTGRKLGSPKFLSGINELVKAVGYTKPTAKTPTKEGINARSHIKKR
jgi:hypothetical protein